MPHKYKLKVKIKYKLKTKLKYKLKTNTNVRSKFKSSKSQKNFVLTGLYNIENLNTKFYQGMILNKFLMELLTNNVKPCSYTTTLHIIKCWNRIVGSQPFASKVRVNIQSKLFNFIRLALTYRCWKSNKSIDDIIKGINHYKYFAETHITLKVITAKLGLLDHFLIKQPYGKDWFNICCTSTLDLARAATINTDKYKYKKTLEDRIIPRFLSIFHPYNKDLGLEEVENNKHLFIKFTDSLVEDHQNRDLNDQTINEYIKDYFHYLETAYTNYVGPVPIPYLFSKSTKFSFFRFMVTQTGNVKYGAWLGEGKDPYQEKSKEQ